jgi:hypothetical protein
VQQPGRGNPRKYIPEKKNKIQFHLRAKQEPFAAHSSLSCGFSCSGFFSNTGAKVSMTPACRQKKIMFCNNMMVLKKPALVKRKSSVAGSTP